MIFPLHWTNPWMDLRQSRKMISKIMTTILVKDICMNDLSTIHKIQSTYFYSGAHISWHELFLAGNQSNHQNLVPSMLTYKFWLIFMGMKKKHLIKITDSKNLRFSTKPSYFGSLKINYAFTSWSITLYSFLNYHHLACKKRASLMWIDLYAN